MTMHRKYEGSRESSFAEVSPGNKNNWPQVVNGSLSWDRNSKETFSSRPGDMEETATQKVLQFWDAVERNLYDEVKGESVQPVLDECDQWKSRLTHLRIVGRCLTSELPQDSNNELPQSASRRLKARDLSPEEITIKDSSDGYKLQGMTGPLRYPGLVEDQNKVFDQIFEFVYSELSKQEEEQKAQSLDGGSDGVSRIIPALTYSSRTTISGRIKRDLEGINQISDYENWPVTSGDPASDGGKENNQTTVATSAKIAENLLNNDSDRDASDEPQVARNKLGTVFNEKVVVSPMPFIVSQRESFTTLRATTISFRTQTFEISMSQGFGRYVRTASNTDSGQRMSGFWIPQGRSAWEAPVYPTVWRETRPACSVRSIATP